MLLPTQGTLTGVVLTSIPTGIDIRLYGSASDPSCSATKVASLSASRIPYSLTLREEHRLGVFENKALRRLFGRKRDEVTREWRKLHY
jgi:hypothetical protein